MANKQKKPKPARRASRPRPSSPPQGRLLLWVSVLLMCAGMSFHFHFIFWPRPFWVPAFVALWAVPLAAYFLTQMNWRKHR